MLNNKQKYQYEFLKTYPIIANAGPWSGDLFKKNLTFALKYFEKFTILCDQEIINELDYLQNLQSTIRNHSNKEIYISCSTTTNYEYSLDPLLNIMFWRDAYSRQQISWIRDTMKDLSIFNKKHYKGGIKNNPFILSVRKQKIPRDFIFNKLTGNYNGIVRYARWPEQGYEDKQWEDDNDSNFPTFTEIIQEYEKTYISFIVETNNECDFMTQFSEKTLLAFLTKTLPIVIGDVNLNKELTEMGFHTLNHMFNINENGMKIDNLGRFVNAVEDVNDMELKSIEKLYNENIDKIEHNYNLVTYLLWGKSLIEHGEESVTLKKTLI